MTEPADRPRRLRLISEEYDLDDVIIREDELPQQPPPRTAKRRQFARYDETWRAQILAAGRLVRPATHRLVAVLLAKADFERRILIGKEIAAEASLTRNEKRQALRQLEKLGLIAVERRGNGRAPIAIPLHLGGRPSRR